MFVIFSLPCVVNQDEYNRRLLREGVFNSVCHVGLAAAMNCMRDKKISCAEGPRDAPH